MAELLKNTYSKEFIEKLSNKAILVYPNFKKQDFTDTILKPSWENLELKERVRQISTTLNLFLPFSYKEQLGILKEIKNDFSYLEAIIFPDFVEVFGIDDFTNSMKALEFFTINSTSEFAIRQFILKYEDETMKQMKIWAKSQNEHIRRLSSEGCRPRLPWGVALGNFKKNPKKVLEIIEILKNDKSKYVQKSVANNLNDISKDNPNLVMSFVKNNLGISKELNWICKHSSRTLLKKGNEEILKLFGFEQTNHIDILNFFYDEKVKIGQDLNFSFELISKDKLGNIRVEYEINYLKQKGKYNKKIFMITQNNFNNNSKKFIKKQSFKDMTTRKHIKGLHNLSIIVNGVKIAKKDFVVY